MRSPVRTIRRRYFGGRLIILFLIVAGIAVAHVSAQQPVIVQPGAPGEPTTKLPATTRASLTPLSEKDVEFMQGMIMHHAQAVEMTAMIEERTTNENIRLLGARISQSQSDEIEFMTRWLRNRGRSAEMPMPTANGGEHAHHGHGGHNTGGHESMPGMLSPEQMKELAAAKGDEFDRLFLVGMIQHHEGALVMVKDLFETAGAGQDAEIFNFSSDVDSGQRAEIKIMRTLLGEKP